MVNYKCPRCGFETTVKTKYIQHLKRKFLCKSTLSENNLGEEYKKYNIFEKMDTLENPGESSVNPCEISTLYPQNIHKIYPNESKKKIYECKYCEKSLSSYKSLWRHYKTCEEKQDEEEKQKLLDLVNLLNKQIEKKDKQIEKKDKQIDELIKKAGINVGTQNIQNQINQEIKILAYNDTDISHLTDSDYLKCIKHANFCIPNLIKQIHFNPTKPENHNIYISNLKNNYVMIYDGNKWLIRDRDVSIQDIIDKNEGIIEQKIEEWIEHGKDYPDIMKKFNKYLEKKENDKVLNKIKSEIKLMLFNNRDMISTI